MLVTHVHRHFVWTVHRSLRQIASQFAAAEGGGELESAMQTETHMRNFCPNFALLNLYADGNHHMNYHQDDETELDQHCVVSLSFGV
jgi:alkylated DNA repair dioxygenase AlkB